MGDGIEGAGRGDAAGTRSEHARTAIADLLARYCIALDRDDVDQVVDLFAADGELVAFGRTHDREGIGRLLRDAPRGVHLAGLPVIEQEGDAARVVQNLVFVDAATREMRLVLYEDEVVATDVGWRFRRRRVRFIGPDGFSDVPPA